jgi:hypothetical protein
VPSDHPAWILCPWADLDRARSVQPFPPPWRRAVSEASLSLQSFPCFPTRAPRYRESLSEVFPRGTWMPGVNGARTFCSTPEAARLAFGRLACGVLLRSTPRRGDSRRRLEALPATCQAHPPKGPGRLREWLGRLAPQRGGPGLFASSRWRLSLVGAARLSERVPRRQGGFKSPPNLGTGDVRVTKDFQKPPSSPKQSGPPVSRSV